MSVWGTGELQMHEAQRLPDTVHIHLHTHSYPFHLQSRIFRSPTGAAFLEGTRRNANEMSQPELEFLLTQQPNKLQDLTDISNI